MPEFSSNEQFQRVLAVAENEIKKNKIKIRFGPLGKMRFVIDEASLKDASAASGVDDAAFREIFHNEVGPLLEAVTRSAVDQYVKEISPLLADARSDPEALATRQAALRERAALVERALSSPELRARYLVKVCSKHPRLKTYNWEVARKLQLSTKEPELQPYATLSFETVRPPDLQIVPWFLFFGGEPTGTSEYCVFDCDEGDLDDLMQDLQEAKAALHRAKKEDGNG
jgi:predicted transcriptional regulator